MEMVFQFTPLREGRPKSMPQRRACEYFNSRPSARGDFDRDGIITPPINFNSRPSARGDGTRAAHLTAAAYFNSRPSARGDRIK